MLNDNGGIAIHLCIYLSIYLFLMASEYQQIEERIAEAMDYRSHPQNTQNPVKITELATMFNVPYQRLQRRLQGHNSRSTRAPTNMRLSSDQEEAILSYMRRCERLGVCVRARAITISANSILRRSHEGDTPAPIVNERWTLRFLQRHPSFVKKKQIDLEAQRVAAYDLKDTEEWFRQLSRLIQDHSIQPEDLWNMDESGFRIGVSKGYYILTEHPKKSHVLLSSKNRESLTVVEAINAAGGAAPPMLVISSKLH